MTKVIVFDDFKDCEWRIVYRFDNYTVSDTGLIRHIRTLTILRPADNGTGYKTVNLCSPNGGRNTRYVHRLVMMTFRPIEGMEDLQVDHGDFDRSNNKLSNLSWATGKDNKNRSRNHGRYDVANTKHSSRTRGWADNGTHNTVKLTPVDVINIRETKDSALALAAKYNVSVVSIFNVRSRKTWKHIE